MYEDILCELDLSLLRVEHYGRRLNQVRILISDFD
jgi:hypothetical protein